MKYVVFVHLMIPPMSCAKLPIPFANDLVHRYQIYLLSCLVKWRYSIALPVSLSINSIVYLGRVVCSTVSILIYASKILRQLFPSIVDTWCFSDDFVANSAEIQLAL